VYQHQVATANEDIAKLDEEIKKLETALSSRKQNREEIANLVLMLRPEFLCFLHSHSRQITSINEQRAVMEQLIRDNEALYQQLEEEYTGNMPNPISILSDSCRSRAGVVESAVR
jgi:chromosome segregation ATPase